MLGSTEISVVSSRYPRLEIDVGSIAESPSKILRKVTGKEERLLYPGNVLSKKTSGDVNVVGVGPCGKCLSSK